MVTTGLFFIFSYLLGALNSSYYFVRLLGKKDIRTVHSGTAGARNVGRIYGKLGFVLIFCIDFLKGACLYWLPYWLPFLYDTNMGLGLAEVSLIGFFFCILGHSYPPQLRFKGGKGVSIYAGFVFFLAPYIFLVGLILLIFGKLVDKKALLLFISGCVINILYFLENPAIERLILLLPTGVVLLRHRTNLTKNQ